MKNSQTEKGDRSAFHRIESAADEVGRRCDEITLHAADPGNMLSECFSLARTIGFNEACSNFLTAIAECEFPADILVAREALERMNACVMQANQKIAARLGDNQELLEGISCCEKTFFKLLVEGDPTLHVVARFAASHLTLVRIVLTAALTNVRKQLERIEHNGEVKVRAFSLKALQQMLAAIRGHVADRAEALDFMRSLYNTRDPEFSSCRKVVDFVRTCKNVHHPYFNQCARIRTLVKTSAKKEVGGEDRVWRSFAQQLKPSHARCRKTKSHR